MPESPSDSPLASLPDQELMLQAQEDDLEAFEVLFRRHERPIYYYLCRLSGDRVGAEDFTQEVFIRLWANRQSYRPTGKFTNYLYQIARNYWINELKRRSIRPKNAPLEAAAGTAQDDHIDEQPLSSLEKRELAELIEQALAEIPEEQREVFILSRHEKMKYKEIADLLDIPVRTVESRLVLATRKLMAKLASYRKLRQA